MVPGNLKSFQFLNDSLKLVSLLYILCNVVEVHNPFQKLICN